MSNLEDKDKQYELDHEYDGIKELDYPLPLWWLITFWGAIVFSIGYYYHYQLSDGMTIQDEYKEDMNHHKMVRKQYMEKLRNFDNDKFLTFYKSSELQSYGKTIFENNCLACHSKDGAGDIGPNLTDNAWLYAEGTPETIYPFILTGNPDSGMPSWADKLEQDDIYSLLAYVMSLQGKEHIKFKEAQGEEYPLWSLKE